MIRSIALATVFCAAPAYAAPAGTVNLKVVGYRSDGIDTSSSTTSEMKAVNVADIRRVSHASSWYYAVETKRGTLLASEMSMAVGGKTATFTGADANPPEGSGASLLDAARRQVSPASAPKTPAAHGRRHR